MNTKQQAALNNLPFFIMTFKCKYHEPKNDYIEIANTLKEMMNDPLVSPSLKELFTDAFYTIPENPEETALVFEKFMNTLTRPNVFEEINNNLNKTK